MQSLSLPPTHRKFPALPVLHAVCAIGSLYTAAVPPPPPLDFSEISPGLYDRVVMNFCYLSASEEIFVERQRLREQRPDTFAERHVKLARESTQRLISLGENLFQVFQSELFSNAKHCTHSLHTANILLTWFFWSHSRFVYSKVARIKLILSLY